MEKIIVLSCTNRPKSYTSQVSKIYSELLRTKNVDQEILSLENIPKDSAFSETFGNRSEEFEKTIEKYIRSQKRFIFIIPEYNGSFPGILKVFLDCVHPREWADKKVCLVGVSSGRGGNIRGMEHITGVLHYLKLHTYHNKLPISLIDKIMGADGKFVHPEQLKACENQIDGFLKF